MVSTHPTLVPLLGKHKLPCIFTLNAVLLKDVIKRSVVLTECLHYLLLLLGILGHGYSGRLHSSEWLGKHDARVVIFHGNAVLLNMAELADESVCQDGGILSITTSIVFSFEQSVSGMSTIRLRLLPSYSKSVGFPSTTTFSGTADATSFNRYWRCEGIPLYSPLRAPILTRNVPSAESFCRDTPLFIGCVIG